MRRIFAFTKRDIEVPLIAGELIDPPAKNDSKERFSQLLDIIYSVNPNLGYPQGDLAMYLSQNTSPEIKAFIEQNLVHQGNETNISMPTEMQNQLRNVISDDDVASFYRRKDESPSDYSERIYGYLKNMKLRAEVKKEVLKSIKVIEANKKLNPKSD